MAGECWPPLASFSTTPDYCGRSLFELPSTVSDAMTAWDRRELRIGKLRENWGYYWSSLKVCGCLLCMRSLATFCGGRLKL